MIEVEKKFILSPAAEARLLEGARFISETKFRDIYFDTVDQKLTSQDWWLRQREEKYELKIPLHSAVPGFTGDQYEEVAGEAKVARRLGLSLDNKSLSVCLFENGYEVLADIITTRRKFKRDEFTFDFDVADYGYRIAEVELSVESVEEAKEAADKIMNLVRACELSPSSSPLRGKIMEYLYRFKPAKYNFLIEVWRRQGTLKNKAD